MNEHEIFTHINNSSQIQIYILSLQLENFAIFTGKRLSWNLDIKNICFENICKRPEVFCKKDVLRNSQENICARASFLIKFKSSRPEAFCEKGVLRNFAKVTGKHLCQSLFLNKVAGLRRATLLKKGLRHRYFPASFVKFLRPPFLKEHLW